MLPSTAREGPTHNMGKPIGIGGWMRRLVLVLAVGYPVALLGVILAFRLIGERWWATTVALYLPRIGFGLPLPFVVVAILFARLGWRWLLTQAVAVVLLLFPLMGLRLGGGHSPTPGAMHLRLLSYNIDGDSRGPDETAAVLRAANPDIICMQETGGEGQSRAIASRLTGYSFHHQGQFALGSRFPIEEAYQPPKIPFEGKMRSVRGMRYRLRTPGGPIVVYSMHPPSPHEGLDELRGQGLRSELGSGHLFGNGRAAAEVTSNATLRVAEVEALSEDAARQTLPVILAGDTNLPGLSWALSRWLGRYQDGFAEAGRGFGYSFPATRRPWMRIDRVLADGRFRFLGFAVGTAHASDHFPVVTDLELSSPTR